MVGIVCYINNIRYAGKYMTEFKKWARAAGIRAIKTIAQTFVATVGTSAVLCEVNWRMVISASILAGILSIATSIAGLPEVKEK